MNSTATSPETPQEQVHNIADLLLKSHARIDMEVAAGLAAIKIDRDEHCVLALVASTGSLPMREFMSRYAATTDLAPTIRRLQIKGLLTRPKVRQEPGEFELRLTVTGKNSLKLGNAVIWKTNARIAGWLGAAFPAVGHGLHRIASIPETDRPLEGIRPSLKLPPSEPE